jgi:uncharacterized protein YabN with tetrapyrrole methylase and pyrophosphatase domain
MPQQEQENEPDIYLLGSGIYSFLDITLLTQHILTEKCRTVYCLHDLPSLEQYLARLTPHAQNLMPVYYRDGRDRSDIYDDIVRHVLATPAEKRPAGLLLHGHPLVYSTISQRLIAECADAGLVLEIVPGVSSLDRMFVDLRLDIGEDGVQVYNASGVLVRNTPLNPGAGCFILQIGALTGTATRAATARPEEISRLKNYLLKFYPPEHPVSIVESAVEIGFQSRVTEIELQKLDEMDEAFNYNASLYLPPGIA